MTAILIELSMKLQDVTGTVKSKMAASKLPKCISQLLHKIYQRNSNGYTNVFGVHIRNEDNGNVVRPNGKKLEMQNPRWRQTNWKYLYMLVDKRGT